MTSALYVLYEVRAAVMIKVAIIVAKRDTHLAVVTLSIESSRS
jgi:hypothetical protein